MTLYLLFPKFLQIVLINAQKYCCMLVLRMCLQLLMLGLKVFHGNRIVLCFQKCILLKVNCSLFCVIWGYFIFMLQVFC